MKQISFKDIYIPSPCNVNWNSMDKGEKSRFCRSCSKTVYDFTQRNEADLNKLLKEEKGEICGRFYEDQVSKHSALGDGQNQGTHLFKKLSLSLLSGVLLKLFTLSTVLSKEMNSEPGEVSVKYPLTYIKVQGTDLPYKIEGKVLAESDGRGLADISVKIYIGDEFLGTTTTDELGIFSLSIEKKLCSGNKIRLETEKTKRKSWKYKTIYKASEAIFDSAETEDLILKIKIKKKKRIHLKRRIMITGKFR